MHFVFNKIPSIKNKDCKQIFSEVVYGFSEAILELKKIVVYTEVYSKWLKNNLERNIKSTPGIY